MTTIQITRQTRKARSLVCRCFDIAGIDRKQFRYMPADQSLHGGAAYVGEWTADQANAFNKALDGQLEVNGWECDPIEIY